LRLETLPQLAAFDEPQGGETGRAKAAGSSVTAESLDVARYLFGSLKPQVEERRQEKRQHLSENGDYDVTKDP